MRAKKTADSKEDEELIIDDENTPYRKVCRSKWAALIKKVYKTDPRLCPHCGAEMKFIAFIEADRRETACPMRAGVSEANVNKGPGRRHCLHSSSC